MSYRDLEDDDPAEVEHVAALVDAPDPTRADETPNDQGRDETVQDGRGTPATLATGRRRRGIAFGIAAAVLAAGGWYVYDRQGDVPQSSPVPAVTASTAPAPGPAPEASQPAAAPTTLGPPMGAATPGPEPATTTAPAGAAITRALTAVRAFEPAWTMKGTPAQRRAALTPVTTTRLVEALADVAADDLPAITGEPQVDSVTAAAVVVDVPTSAGTAQLTVEPIDGRWLVTTVSLTPPPSTTPAAAA